MDVRGWIKHSETYVYDLDGRVTSQVTSGRVLGWTAVGGHTASDEDELYNLTTLSTVTTYYDGLSRSSGYKWNYLRHDENYTGPASDPVGYTHTYAITYEARDSYLEKSIYGYSTNSYYKASTSTMQYDAWGRMVGVRENTPNQTIDDRLRYFAYDGEGGVLRRREGTVDSHNVFTQTADQINKDSVFAYANGQQLAEQSRDGTKLDVYGQFGNTETVPEHLSKKQQKAANKSAALGNHTGAYDTYTQRYTAYDANSMGSQRVVVQQGESLQSIAQRVYGNASLWYVLASANALSTNSDLIAGTQLKVPDVGISKNTSSTFKPYNPSEIIGNTSPNLPYMPPPPGMSCGQTFALIIATVIRVVTQWIGHVLVATGYLAWLAPIVGAAGEFVAQTVEKDAGLRDEYNWGAVAVAAVTVFIVGSEESTIGQDIGRAMLTAAASYVGSYLVNRALGHEDHFSLKAMLGQVAVAGVTTGLGDEMSGVKNGVDPTGGMVSKTAGSIQINWSQVASYVVKQTVQNVVTNVVGGLVYSAVTGEAYKFDPRAVLADAFGNALGSAATTIMDAEWKNHLENKEKMKNLTQSQRKEYDFWRSKGQGQGLALYNALDEGGLQKRMAGLLFQSHDDADTEQGGEGGVETSPQVTTISVQMDAAESPDSDQSNFIGGDPNHPNDPRRWIVAPDFAEPEYYPVAGSTDANAGSSDASAGTSTVAAACSATSTDAGNANTAAAASSSSDHIGEGFDTVFANDPEGIHREFFGDDQSPDVAQTLISTTRRKHPHSATYGPLFSGSESLADYPGWNELINCGTVTKSEQNIMVAVSPNEGKLDTIQAWDSEVLTAGAMQKTIRVEGGGEFPQQVYEFGQEHPDLYKKLFVDHGWEVSDVNGTKTMSYKGVTGSALKTELRVGFDQTAWANKTKVFSEPLSSIVDAISTDEFKAKQVTDFVARLRTAISIKPTKGQDLTIGDYLQSDLGRALVLDEHINRPNDVKGDFSAALKGFFHANPLAPSDPANWGANRAIYEQQLIQIYGPNRSMTQGYKRYMNLVRRL
jgi:LysM repeat protein